MSDDSGISIKVIGDKQIGKALDKLVNNQERTALMSALGAYGLASTQQRFITETDPDGKKWKKSLRAETQGHTLRDRGHLYASFNWAATTHSAEWGTPFPWAGIHQFGGTIKPKEKGALSFRLFNGQFVMVKQVKMPKRAMLGINEQDNTAIGNIVTKWMGGAFK